jgi:hypothetical protein
VTINSKLAACPTQFVNHLNRLRTLLVVLTPCQKNASHQDGQLLLQMTITRLHTYMEAYYKCMVSTATFWTPEPVREYVSARKPEQADNIVGLPVAALGKWAEKEVAFGDRFDGLKGIVNALFGVSPFPNTEAELKCNDLVIVRNAAVHQLGLVGAAEARAINTPGVIVPTGKVGDTQFYRLEITPEFFLACAEAVGAAVEHLRKQADTNPKFSYAGGDGAADVLARSSSGSEA